MALEHYNTLRASSLPYSFKKREREQKQRPPQPPERTSNHHPSPSNQPYDPLPPSHLSSVPHLFSWCLISPAGSMRAGTMVSLFHTEPNYIATIINTFSNTLFRRTQSTLGVIVWFHALVFFSEDVQSTKVSLTVCC